MTIPSNLVIQDAKITKYLLVYQPKSDKIQVRADYICQHLPRSWVQVPF